MQLFDAAKYFQLLSKTNDSNTSPLSNRRPNSIFAMVCGLYTAPYPRVSLGSVHRRRRRNETYGEPQSADGRTHEHLPPRWGCTSRIQLAHSLKAPGFSTLEP